MRFLVTGLMALILSSCANTSYPGGSNTIQQYDTSKDITARYRAVEEMRARLYVACVGSDPLDPYLGTMPVIEAAGSDVDGCFRSKLASAFDSPEGITNCATESQLGKYVVCLAMGKFLNDMRRGAGSPRSLSAAEWHDHNAAVTNTVKELAIQSIVQCAKLDGRQKIACQDNIVIAAFGIAPLEADECRGSAFYSCLASRAITRFIQDRALLLW